jgi:hypothetical protein
LSKTTFIAALVIGAIMGILTKLFIQSPVLPDGGGVFVIFLIPGFIAGIIANNNVHDPNQWVAILGNFLFYSALTYLASVVRNRITRRAAEREK